MSETETTRPSAASARPSPIPWPPILLVTLAATAILMARSAPLTWSGMNDLPSRVIGLSIGAAGILLAIWAVATLRGAQTTVMPHKSADRLVTSGPYRRFRNPIYIADVMLLLGLAEVTKNLWLVVAAALFVPLVTWLAILPEERHLAARFGAAWEDYKAHSRRWL